MSNAPERIGLIGDSLGLWSLWNRKDYGGWRDEDSVEYIRADLHTAAIEAARAEERERWFSAIVKASEVWVSLANQANEEQREFMALLAIDMRNAFAKIKAAAIREGE